MDDCPISFGTSHPLLPRLIPASSAWTYIDPMFSLDLTFGENMNQVTKPDASEFVFLVDGVEKVPTDEIWSSATVFNLQFSEALLAPTVVRCRYKTKNPDFESSLGEVVTPFDILSAAP